MKYKNYISKEQLLKYNTIKFPGKIHYISSIKEAIDATNFLKEQNLLGFDTESVPYKVSNPLKKLALIQLCNENDCFLFHVLKLGVPDKLVDIFSDENILKIGLALKGDLKELSHHKEFEPRGFIDLQQLVKEYNIKVLSLTKISAVVLGSRVSKRQQRSNWGRSNLSDAQKLYAATDAWVSLMIYKKLKGL